MKPVKQTKFGVEGNCYLACLASILEIPIEAVPNISMGSENWLADFDEWLRICHDYTLLGFRVGSKKDFYCIPAVHHIMVGPSPRELNHAVVGFQGEMVHDPHPEGGGLVRVERYEFLYPCNGRATDLKLIDELLVDMKGSNKTWKDMENESSITRDAMTHLRQAWISGEMPVITLSLANYFRGETI